MLYISIYIQNYHVHRYPPKSLDREQMKTTKNIVEFTSNKDKTALEKFRHKFTQA